MLEESIGMLGLQLWLATLEPELADLATSWRGDRFHLRARSDLQLDVFWVIQLEDEASAGKILKQGLAMIGYIANLEKDPAAGENVETPDGRRLRADMGEKGRVIFTNLGPE